MIQRIFRALPRLYWLTVVLPFVLISIYIGALQSPKYESEAAILVQNADPLATSLPSVELGLLSLGGANEAQDAALVESFIRSRRLFDQLQDKHGLLQHWQEDTVDWVSRLPRLADKKEQFDYYLSMVRVQVDPDSGVVRLAVRAYSPEKAQTVLTDIVELSEQFINQVAQDLARSQVGFAEYELERAYERVKSARNSVLAFQGATDSLSPEAEAEASLQILGALQARKSGLETELSTVLTYLQDDAPDVVSLRNRIAATEEQIARERMRQTGASQDGLNLKVAGFKEAELTAQLAADIYKVGLQTLESARLEASRKGKFLVQVDPPHLPDEPRLPQFGRSVLLAALALNVLYFVMTLIGAAIREHSD